MPARGFEKQQCVPGTSELALGWPRCVHLRAGAKHVAQGRSGQSRLGPRLGGLGCHRLAHFGPLLGSVGVAVEGPDETLWGEGPGLCLVPSRRRPCPRRWL